ncbi:uncharacterized protein LOC128119304 [Peromyscus californicus insignis]|uniref:uncharacterized protein LOC128119304 n=1 Tax=Peromyscus californicus insignis TaxID=564181 RepID=UPI0022A6B903|nr:uncharacterized protein LOC128119304 [Peromyscus californicus insignis]
MGLGEVAGPTARPPHPALRQPGLSSLSSAALHVPAPAAASAPDRGKSRGIWNAVAFLSSGFHEVKGATVSGRLCPVRWIPPDFWKKMLAVHKPSMRPSAEQCVQSPASSSPFVESVQLFVVAWDLFRRLQACSCPACAKMEEIAGSLKLNSRTKQQPTDQQPLEDGQEKGRAQCEDAAETQTAKLHRVETGQRRRYCQVEGGICVLLMSPAPAIGQITADTATAPGLDRMPGFPLQILPTGRETNGLFGDALLCCSC